MIGQGIKRKPFLALAVLLTLPCGQAQAQKYQNELEALNLCMYAAGIRLYGISPANMLRLVKSSCDGKMHTLAEASSNKPAIDPGGPISLPTEDETKEFERQQANVANAPMVKFAIDYFMSDYAKALKAPR